MPSASNRAKRSSRVAVIASGALLLATWLSQSGLSPQHALRFREALHAKNTELMLGRENGPCQAVRFAS
jgi:hypothetical protein